MIRAKSKRIEIRHILLPCRSIVTYSQYSWFQRILYQRYPKGRAMQRRKIAVACLSLLLVGLALPTTNINKAHAFTNGNNTVTISNVLTGFSSPTVGSGTVAQAGSTITVTVVIQASAPPPSSLSYQRNVTIGFKGDWMTSYQNASIITLTAGQIGSTTLSIVLPPASSISPNHSWNVQLWDGPATGPVSNCTPGDGNDPKNCFIPLTFGGVISFLTADQYSAAQARNAALTALSSVVIPGTGIILISNQAAVAQLTQASAELKAGDQSWTNGDFAGAKTHYQNSQTNVNNALQTQYNLGGSQQNASIVSVILGGAGTAMFGLGGLLAGIGGFFYLRRRPKA